MDEGCHITKIIDILNDISTVGSKNWIFFREGQDKLEVLVAPKTWLSRLVAWLRGYKSYQDTPYILAQKFCEVLDQCSLSEENVRALIDKFSARIIKERSWWSEYKPVKSVFDQMISNIGKNLYWDSVLDRNSLFKQDKERRAAFLTRMSGSSTPSRL